MPTGHKEWIAVGFGFIVTMLAVVVAEKYVRPAINTATGAPATA